MSTIAFKSFGEVAAFLRRKVHEVEGQTRHGVEAGAKIIEAEAKGLLGTYAAGWPQLAVSTQADRVRKGFPANEPELRTGDLRSSIDHKVTGSHSAEVGSDSKIAAWQEMGTSKMPARSFLASAGMRKGQEAAVTIGKVAMAPLTKR